VTRLRDELQRPGGRASRSRSAPPRSIPSRSRALTAHPRVDRVPREAATRSALSRRADGPARSGRAAISVHEPSAAFSQRADG
jgi:hypothetical protein